jgi:peptidoglycan/LPS O-acetylase OafA/YrhL
LDARELCGNLFASTPPLDAATNLRGRPATPTDAMPQQSTPHRMKSSAVPKGTARSGAMRKPELPALTGIRFYAALLVFLSHVPLIQGMDQLAGHHLLFNAGVVGVSFFFVLSGFILTYNYVDVFSLSLGRRDYWKFLWDRLTKIYPVHFAITLLMIPLQFLSPNLPLDWRAAPVHLLLAQCFWPSPQPPFYSYLNVPSWSISCEWFFYLCAPLILYALAGRYLRVALFSLLAAYACAFAWFVAGSSDLSKLFYVSWFAPSRLPEFVTGVMLARLYLSTRSRMSNRLAGTLQLAGLALILTGALYRAQAPWPFWGGLLYVPGSATLIYGLAQNRGALAAHLGRRSIQILGTASFSFYLIHAPILRGLRMAWRSFGSSVESWSAFLLTCVTVFVLVQALAIAVCYLYELPLQKALRKLGPSRPNVRAERDPTDVKPLRARAAGSSS